MATWITHLRLAESFRDRFDNDEYNYFLIGNIAPDSGMLNEDKLTYTPSTEISHFLDKEISKWGNSNLDFYRKFLNSISFTNFDNQKAFKLGYFIHLFLDNLWGYYIYNPIKNKFQYELEKDPQYIWEIKLDWYGIDQEYLEENKKWSTWNLFNTLEYQYDYLNFYPQKAINSKLCYIKDFYNNGDKIVRPYKFLSNEEMDKFVSLSAYWINIGLNILKSTKTNHNSIMNLMEENFNCFRSFKGNLNSDYSTYILKKNN